MKKRFGALFTALLVLMTCLWAAVPVYATSATVYVQGNYAGGDSDGSRAKPYNTLSGAYAHCTEGDDTICLLSDVTISAGLTVGQNVTVSSDAGHSYSVKRGTGMTAEPMFTVSTGFTLTLSDIILDGQEVSATAPLIDASNGSLTLGSGAVLQNGVNTAAGAGGILAGNNNVTVGGTAVVYGNTANGEPSDLYLPAGSVVSVSSLSAGARIGVRTASAPAAGSPVQITGTASDADREYFVSNQTGVSITRNTNLYLTAVSDPSVTAALGSSDNTHYYITVDATTVDWWYGIRGSDGNLLSPSATVDESGSAVSAVTGNTGWYRNTAASGGKLVFGPLAAGTGYTAVACQNGGTEKVLQKLTTPPVDPTVASASRPAAGMPALAVGHASVAVSPTSASYEYQLYDVTAGSAVSAPTAVNAAGALLPAATDGWITGAANGKLAFTGLTASHSYKMNMRIKTEAANNPLAGEILPQDYPTSTSAAITTLAAPTVQCAKQGTSEDYYITVQNSAASLEYAVVDASGTILPSGSSWVAGNGSTLSFGPYSAAGALTVLSKPKGFTPASSPIVPATDKVLSTLGSYTVPGVRAENDPDHAGKGRVVVVAPSASLWYNVVLTSSGTVVGSWTQHTDGSDIVFDNLSPGTTYTVITNSTNTTPSTIPAGTQVTTPPASVASSSVTRWPTYIEIKSTDSGTQYALLDQGGTQLTAVKATTAAGAALTGSTGWYSASSGSLLFVNLDPSLTYQVASRQGSSPASTPLTVYALRTEAPTQITATSAALRATFTGASWTNAQGSFQLNSTTSYTASTFAQSFRLGLGGMTASTTYSYQAQATVDGVNYRGEQRFLTTLPSTLPTGTITVSVTNLSAAASATLSLCAGTNVLQTADLDMASGVSSSVFRNVANGAYNVTLESGGKIATRMVVVTNGAGSVILTCPADLIAETSVTVANGLPPIAVGNLPSLLTTADQTAIQTNGQHVVYDFQVSTGAAADEASLETFAKTNWGSYKLYGMEFELLRTAYTAALGDGGTVQPDAAAVLEIAIPIPTSLQSDAWKIDREIAVLRYHGGTAQVLPELSSRQSSPVTEGYYVDYDSATAYVYASRFSLYAVAQVSDPLSTGSQSRTLTGTVGTPLVTLTVTGSIPTTTTLNLTADQLHAESANCEACTQIRQMIKDGKTISTFEAVLKNGAVAPFSGRLTFTATVPTEYNGKTLQIVHCSGGTLETINAKAEDGKVTFTTNSDGIFSIVKSATATNPETGDAALLRILIPVGAGLLVLAGVTALLAVRRRRRKRSA